MKKLLYQNPQIEEAIVAVERGFAQSSNLEDPIEKPDQEW